MKLSIISFTEAGCRLSERLADCLADMWHREDIRIYTKCGSMRQLPGFEPRKIGDWTREQLEKKHGVIFIGACGIAVRAIAPWITDKLHDSPVLVMDERGIYVIPVLSGHMGGANELARIISRKLGAVPVITTATDLNGKFAVDLFARRNGLAVVNKGGIARVSAKVLAGETVTISVESGHWENGAVPDELRMVSYPPQVPVDILVSSEKGAFQPELWLRPREYVIGMGCRKGTEAGKIEALIGQTMQKLGIEENQVLALTSVDKKKEEEGLLAWSRKSGIPFWTYTSAQLNAVKGSFTASEFVEAAVGVDNVCERAACCDAGKAEHPNGRLIMKKYAEDGMTIAVARRDWSVRLDET